MDPSLSTGWQGLERLPPEARRLGSSGIDAFSLRLMGTILAGFRV